MEVVKFITGIFVKNESWIGCWKKSSLVTSASESEVDQFILEGWEIQIL